VKPYYQDDAVTLYRGDALAVLADLPAESVDTLVTDPPYFLPAAHYSVRSGSFRSLSDLSILEHFFRDVFAQVGRILKPTGTAYVFCDGQSYPAFYAVGYATFHRMRPLIWDKQTSINGYSWRHQHELVLFATMPDAPNVPTGDGDVLRERAVPIKERQHLAQKPVPLLTRLIEKTCPPDGTVLDPFIGSGSTLKAAKLCGRKSIGIEAEARYCDIAVARLAQGQDAFDLGGVA
jgi:site-specific DNA-methyltransferase (adenine-specific)